MPGVIINGAIMDSINNPGVAILSRRPYSVLCLPWQEASRRDDQWQPPNCYWLWPGSFFTYLPCAEGGRGWAVTLPTRCTGDTSRTRGHGIHKAGILQSPASVLKLPTCWSEDHHSTQTLVSSERDLRMKCAWAPVVNFLGRNNMALLSTFACPKTDWTDHQATPMEKPNCNNRPRRKKYIC